jgi:TolB protein
MKLESRYVSLLLSLCLLFFPLEVSTEIASGESNSTQTWNFTNNTSDYYLDWNNNSGCAIPGKISNSGIEISANNIIEETTFLSNSTESEVSPIWSADGNYILYNVQKEGAESSESYKIKPDGSGKEKLVIGEENSFIFNDINPNGTELIITKSRAKGSGIQIGLYVAILENKTIIPVADDSDKFESGGAWCRLGKKIIYTQKPKDLPSQLWITDRQTGETRRLGTSENIGNGKDWCPLGLKVIYSARDSKEKDELWEIDWHNISQIQLTNTPYGEWNPAFSPDGKKIVYVSDEGGKPDIWIRDIEGNYRARLTKGLGIDNSTPKWSPEGTKILFVAHNSLQAFNNSIDTNPANEINSRNAGNLDIALIKLKPAFFAPPIKQEIVV